MAQELIDVASDDRVAIFGQTGSGKTFFARYLLRHVQRLVVVDPKGMLRGQWGLVEWGQHARKLLRQGKPARVRIPSPLDPREWDEIFRYLYECGDLVIYIDEMYGVVPIGKRAPNYLNACYTRGRELGIGVYASSQRPTSIPREMVSESSWFFCFRLLLEDDRKRVSEFMGPAAMMEIPDDHGFLVYNASWRDGPRYVPELEVGRHRAQKGA